MDSTGSTGKPPVFQIRFLGTGNAFAQGAKGYQSIYVVCEDTNFLVDCGPTAQLIASQHGINLSALDAIFFTHIHGDHALGLPFILLQMQFVGERTRPLTIVVPPGQEDFPDIAMRLAFPDVHRMGLRFPLEIRTLAPSDGPVPYWNMTVQAFPMQHSIPVNGLRFERDGVVMAITGDTTPCPAILELERDSDLLVMECSARWKIPDLPHTSHEELLELASRLTTRHLVVVHTDGLFDPSPFHAPEDGEVIAVP